jgi:hypothetical protein
MHQDDTNTKRQRHVRPLSLMKAILGDCICNPFQNLGENRGNGPSTQLVELNGVRFIGLGALIDELTPRERVYDTLEQLTTRTDRLVSVGYLLNDVRPTVEPSFDGRLEQPTPPRKVTETVPLDIWIQNFPDDNSVCFDVKRTIEHIRVSVVQCYVSIGMEREYSQVLLSNLILH